MVQSRSRGFSRSIAGGLSDMDLAARVSAQVDLESIRLVESTCALGEAGGPGPASVDFTAAGDTRVEQSTGRVFVTVHFGLIAKRDEVAAANTFVTRVSATFRLQYRLTSAEGLDKRHYDAFGRLNGMFNAWPYWREFVQSMTVRMGLPTLIVPLLKVGVAGDKNPKEARQRSSKTAR